MLSIAVLCLYSAFTKSTFYSIISGLMIIFLSVLLFKVLPLANQYLQGSLYKFSLYAKDNLSRDDKIIVYGINNPSIVFYSGHNVINISGKENLMTLMKSSRHTLAIAKANNIDVLKDLGFNIIQKDEKYAIFERK
jgi:hypothetical protein